jgi:uracil-DNA glycosylase family 4
MVNDPTYRRRVDRISALNAQIVACRACPRLVAWREQVGRDKRAAFAGDTYWAKPIPGFGDREATLLVVGLAPAAHGGNRTGRVFTGDRSGDWLFRSLWKAGFANQAESRGVDDGLQLVGAYIAAVVRCAPPANKPTVDERDRCRPYLERELALLAQLRVVVCLGQYAYENVAGLVGLRPRPRFGHGVEVAVGGRTIVCSFHPSQQNTFTGRLTESMLDDVFARARELCSPPPFSAY